LESGHETALALGEERTLGAQRWADAGHVQPAVGWASEEREVAQPPKAKTRLGVSDSLEVRPRKQPTCGDHVIVRDAEEARNGGATTIRADDQVSVNPTTLSLYPRDPAVLVQKASYLGARANVGPGSGRRLHQQVVHRHSAYTQPRGSIVLDLSVQLGVDARVLGHERKSRKRHRTRCSDRVQYAQALQDDHAARLDHVRREGLA